MLRRSKSFKGRRVAAALTFGLAFCLGLEPPPAQAACDLPSERPFKKSFEEREGFDSAAAIDSAVASMGQHYMGYVVLFQGRAGEIIARARYGFARTPCESAGQQRFNLDTQTAWGSVTKVITGALVIDKTERSTVRDVGERMIDFLPERWRDEVHPGHSDVTIRQLLQHKSGFGDSGRDLRARLAQPPEKPVGVRDYNNANFSIFQYMGRFFRKGRWDELEAAFTPGEITYNSYAFSHGLAIYRDALERRISDPLGLQASCNVPDHAGGNYAHYYFNPQSKRGYFLNPTDKPGCTVGGIVMSPRDMGKFLHALTRTDQIVSKENYRQLMAVDSNDRMVWAGKGSTVGGTFFTHNGARNFSLGGSIPGNPGGKQRAQIMAFPNGMSALAVINSDIPEGAPSLRKVLKDAFEAGARAP